MPQTGCLLSLKTTKTRTHDARDALTSLTRQGIRSATQHPSPESAAQYDTIGNPIYRSRQGESDATSAQASAAKPTQPCLLHLLATSSFGFILAIAIGSSLHSRTGVCAPARPCTAMHGAELAGTHT
mmetsp:Transcript_23269/g.66091  ORF Transcript_23269/g.66091 Transcript_23269/m.66091 type:complete len:127 (-) Transcript_23269:61-441(-)